MIIDSGTKPRTYPEMVAIASNAIRSSGDLDGDDALALIVMELAHVGPLHPDDVGMLIVALINIARGAAQMSVLGTPEFDKFEHLDDVFVLVVKALTAGDGK